MALVLYKPLFWFALLAIAAGYYWLARRRHLRWQPAWWLRLLLCALILTNLFSPRGELFTAGLASPQVMVLDFSDSLSPESLSQLQRSAQNWQAAAPNRTLIAYGNQPQVILDPAQPWHTVDGRQSDTRAALSQAERLLAGRSGNIILASDGLDSFPPGVAEKIFHLLQDGITLEIQPLTPRMEAEDGAIQFLPVYPALWEGTPFDVTAWLYPPQSSGDATFTFKINDYPFDAQVTPLGNNLYRFSIPAQKAGSYTLQVTVDFHSNGAGLDAFPENNSAYAALRIYESPRSLLISAQPQSAAVSAFTSRLQSNGLNVEVIEPQDLPTDLNALQAYQVILVHNLLASSLNQEQMLTLRLFVTRLAGGLVFLGGRNSYSLGGYQDTILEPLLPVKLQPPPRSERNPITFVIIIDRSASMRTAKPGFNQPIILAREAAMRAIENLTAQDTLGVLTFSDQAFWTVKLAPLGDGLNLRQALDKVSAVKADGGTNLYKAMQTALAEIELLPNSAPRDVYILLLSDGMSFDGSPELFEELAMQASQRRITISTIALGIEADQELMSHIAGLAQGRYYPVLQAEDLPKIMITEAQAARSENLQAGPVNLEFRDNQHPVLFGLSNQQLPQLNSYNALTSRAEEGAEDILVSANFQDPILSDWQVGLGRVIAWSSDIGEEWSGQFSPPEAERTFWTQVIRYALASPNVNPVQVDVQVQGNTLVVEALLQSPDGAPLNSVNPRFEYLLSADQVVSIALPQIAPGRYRLETPAPPIGAYQAIFSYQEKTGESEMTLPFVINAPLEWVQLDATASQSNLADWMRLAGKQSDALTSPVSALEASQPEPVTARSDTWLALLIIALLYWPLEIAIRRRWLPWV